MYIHYMYINKYMYVHVLYSKAIGFKNMMLHILHLYNYVHIYIYMTHGTKLLPLASCVCVFWSFGSSHHHSFGGSCGEEGQGQRRRWRGRQIGECVTGGGSMKFNIHPILMTCVHVHCTCTCTCIHVHVQVSWHCEDYWMLSSCLHAHRRKHQ